MENVIDIAQQSFPIEINEKGANFGETLTQLTNDLGGFYDRFHSEHYVNEQSQEEPTDPSVDSSAINEQFQAVTTDPADNVGSSNQRDTELMHSNQLNDSAAETTATQNLSNALETTNSQPDVFIRNPVRTIFRTYTESDFSRNNIRGGIPKLEDCLHKAPLWFGPVSAFANAEVECTLVFIGPNGGLFNAPYGFVRDRDNDMKIENPSVFHFGKDAVVLGDLFSLNPVICKLANNMFQSSNKQGKTTCKIRPFSSDTALEIDYELFSTLRGNHGSKKMNKNDQHVTLTKLAKHFKVYTPYLVMRRTHWNDDLNKYVPEADILFCSNAFTPVYSSVPREEYDETPNELKITGATLSRNPSLQNTNQYNLNVSFIIPKMYECTQLKNKWLKVTILTTSKEHPCIHPLYKILAEGELVESAFTPADQYVSTLTLNLVERTMDEHENSMSSSNPSLSSADNPSVQMVPSNIPSLVSFRVQLQLCDYSTGELHPYPNSTVASDIVIDDPTSSEENTRRPTTVNDNLIVNSTDQSSSLIKRSNEKENNTRSDSPPLKHVKHT